MPVKYLVTTTHILPETKKWFECYCSAKNYMKEMLAKSPADATQEDLLLSVRLTRADEDRYAKAALPFPV